MTDDMTYHMFTFRSSDEKITASARLDSAGDLYIQMKPEGQYSEEEMYKLFESLGFKESLEPLKNLKKFC